MKKNISLSCILLLVSYVSISQYVINGDAVSLGSNEFRLTEADFYQNGSVWNQNKLDLRFNFHIEAKMYFGDNDGGADGMAFVLQKESVNAGSAGGGLGYEGINPSLDVEFDTWMNNDPPEDHIGINKNGNVEHSGPNSLLSPFDNPSLILPNIEDDAYHDAVFDWDATTHVFKVTFDGVAHSITYDLINDIFSGDYFTFWGFTGATGAAVNVQKVKIMVVNVVTENVVPTFVNDATIVLNTSCMGNNGNISIIPLTGVAPFMYSIDGGTTYIAGPDAGYTFINLGIGSYNLRLKDANNIESDIVNREIVQQYGDLPTFLNNNQIVLEATCGNNDGNISIIPTSGTPPFMYSIDGGTTYVSGPNSGYTFTNLAPGVYHLRLKSGTGCESDVVERTVGSGCNRSSNLSRGATLGTAKPFYEAGSSNVVSTYPNPTKGVFRVMLNNIATSKAEISVFDSKGSFVQRKVVNLKEGSNVEFNLSEKAPGLYMIRIVSDKGTTTSRVLVQK